MTSLLYLHGFASSVHGRKGQFLRARCQAEPDLNFHPVPLAPTPVDFEYMTITGMIARVRQYVLDRKLTDFLLIGSSMGGLVALHYAHRYGNAAAPGTVARLLLLAPTLAYLSGERVGVATAEWAEKEVGEVFHYGFDEMTPLRYDLERDGRFYQTPPPPPVSITIIHGRKDEVAPIAGSRAYAAQYSDQVRLIEIEAGHDINDHLDLIWQHVIMGSQT